MAINKIINVNDGSGREFTENTVAELKFDTKPEVGSFNAVTSDAVARAVAGASGEVPQVTENDNDKVLTAVYDEGGPAVEWGEAQGAEYTAGEGISISDENVISCTVQGPSAGAGINITYNTVSVNHDSTLTEVGGEQNTPFPVETSVARGPNGKGKAWATNAVEVDLSNPETDENDRPILRVHLADTYGSPYSLDFGTPVEGFDLPLYPCITLVKPDDPTKYLSCRDMNVEVHYVDFAWRLPVATLEVILENFIFSDGSTSSYTDLLVDGKALLYITLATPGKGGSTPVTGTDADPSDYYARFVGPARDGANMLAAQLGYAHGSPTVPPAIDWDSYVDSVTGYGTAELSVANPVPSYSTSEDGKVLGVVDNSGTAELQWVSAGTTYVSGSSASVSLSADDTVVTNSVDVTGITVGAGVHSAIVQWVVDSTTTLPTVTDGTNALKAAVNNPSSLTVGRTVQVSILNGTWVCAEFA